MYEVNAGFDLRLGRSCAAPLSGAAGHRWQDHERVAVADRGVEALEHPDVLVV